MYYLEMRPDQIRDAIARNLPVIMAAGCVEYHGPHLPVGTDCFIAETIVSRVERQCECVVLPALPFSPTMFWAGAAEDGEFDFDPEVLKAYAREIFRGLVKAGFRRIYVLQHHQGENGLPALALKMAAAEVTREAALQWPPCWGRLPGDQLPDPDLFERIRIAHIDSFGPYEPPDAQRCPVGHGGRGETQLTMVDHADCVDMERLDTHRNEMGNLPPWLEDAHLATVEQGQYWMDFCVQGWVRELTKKQ